MGGSDLPQCPLPGCPPASSCGHAPPCSSAEARTPTVVFRRRGDPGRLSRWAQLNPSRFARLSPTYQNPLLLEKSQSSAVACFHTGHPLGLASGARSYIPDVWRRAGGPATYSVGGGTAACLG
eukprot:gene12828-biopygen38212